ncbi:NAD(P)H-dependent glycerol-3-phosphate dehydrogenase [Heliomarina baculiformis]|uniref:NAD(P)H-dependent glycerol-3-phosphate dehydrogenase n=1 Tax=Heliomarina baculiformis TaxID=2872036 RepID=UPI001EE2CC4A|nr:NAD(P)H-dependent glycerol-3-phosphate dehydrogenase [Heliomarina baculiformis]
MTSTLISPTSQSTPYSRIAVVGGGAWGTALASVAARAGRQVRIYARDEATVDAINNEHRNPRYLGDIALPETLKATHHLAEAVTGADAVLLVVPSGAVRQTAAQLRDLIMDGTPVAVCTKGIEPSTGALMSQVVAEEIRHVPVGTISGPTFARETALGHPTAATVAFDFSHQDRLDPYASPAAQLALSMSTGFFKTYISDDLVGVEIGGAIKNVIAIGCGMMTGAGYAENTRAALITRGMDEMKQLAEALGGRRETVTGLAGAGDLTLTCSSQTSRNMSLGVQLGQGIPRDQCFDGKPVVVEGEANAASVVDLARRVNVTMPICETVHSILTGEVGMSRAFADLWTRPIESEPRALAIEMNNPAMTSGTRLDGGAA